MSWQPKFQAHFIEPIAANLLAEVSAERFAESSAWANGGTALTYFRAVYNSAFGRRLEGLPVLMLVDAQTEDNIADDESFIGQRHTLTFELYVAASTAEQAQTLIYRYVRAVDSIWRSMTREALGAGLEEDGFAGLQIQSIKHRYAVQGQLQGRSDYVNAARMEVTVTNTER